MDAIYLLMRSLRKKTGIMRLNPSIYPPVSNHADVTDGYDSRYLMLKNWGTLKNPMLHVYAKPGEDYITKYALEKAGIKTSQKTKVREKTLDPITCPQCSSINPPGKGFCGQCRFTLSDKAKIQLDTTSQKLQKIFTANPKAESVFLEPVKELKV